MIIDIFRWPISSCMSFCSLGILLWNWVYFSYVVKFMSNCTNHPTVFFLMTADYVLNSNVLSFIPNIDDLNFLSVFFSDLLAIHQFYWFFPPKNQLLVSFIFPMSEISLIYLIFIIPFIFLALDLFLSYFHSSWVGI